MQQLFDLYKGIEHLVEAARLIGPLLPRIGAVIKDLCDQLFVVLVELNEDQPYCPPPVNLQQSVIHNLPEEDRDKYYSEIDTLVDLIREERKNEGND